MLSTLLQRYSKIFKCTIA